MKETKKILKEIVSLIIEKTYIPLNVNEVDDSKSKRLSLKIKILLSMKLTNYYLRGSEQRLRLEKVVPQLRGRP